MGDFAGRRAFTRLRFNNGLKGELRLMDRVGELMSDSYAAVMVLSMDPDGLCFMSGLKLPVNRGYYVDFRFTIGGILLQIRGNVTWRRLVDNHYEYGILFYPPYKLRPLLLRILNQELLRQNPRDYKLHRLYRRLNQNVSRL